MVKKQGVFHQKYMTSETPLVLDNTKISLLFDITKSLEKPVSDIKKALRNLARLFYISQFSIT